MALKTGSLMFSVIDRLHQILEFQASLLNLTKQAFTKQAFAVSHSKVSVFSVPVRFIFFLNIVLSESNSFTVFQNF